MEKSRHTALVRELMEAVRASDPPALDGQEGGGHRHPGGARRTAVPLFDELGLAIVADDLAQESRQVRVDVPEGDEAPLYRLARVWQNMYGCPLATDTKKAAAPCSRIWSARPAPTPWWWL